MEDMMDFQTWYRANYQDESGRLFTRSELHKAYLAGSCTDASEIGPWISILDRQPEEGVSVLIAMSGHVGKTAWYRGEFIMPSKAQPTHWMPLPEAPK